jgi:hypothetical protein
LAEYLRGLARNEWSVRGAWTQSILAELLRSSVLTDFEYIEAVGKLTLLNYKFIFLKADMIMWVLERTKYAITAEVRVFFAIFQGPECTLESAVGVLSDVAKRVWLEPLFYETKLKILDEILGTITKGRPLNESLAFFLVVMKDRFLLMPNAYDAIYKYTDLWRRLQTSKTGVIGMS